MAADEIIITSPLQTESVLAGLFGEQAPRVFIYSGNQTVAGNVTSQCKSWTSPCPEYWVGKHLSNRRYPF